MKPKTLLIGAIIFLVFLVVALHFYPEFASISKTEQKENSIESPMKYALLENSSKTESFEKIKEEKSGFYLEFNPSINEIRQVLKENKIDKVVYSDDFNCVEFSFGLVKALRDEGIYSCVTWVIFEEGSHALVAVNTSYYGVIYIEPQTDKIVYSLKESDDYCDAVGWNCDWKIQKIKSCFSEIDY